MNGTKFIFTLIELAKEEETKSLPEENVFPTQISHHDHHYQGLRYVIRSVLHVRYMIRR
jgi:hypothetical protein